MRCVVLGAPGQLGRDLCPRLVGEVVPLSRADLDLTDPALPEKLASYAPEMIVNCAAYNFVDRAETEPEVAAQVNAWSVRRLTLCANALGATLVRGTQV